MGHLPEKRKAGHLLGDGVLGGLTEGPGNVSAGFSQMWRGIWIDLMAGYGCVEKESGFLSVRYQCQIFS